MTRFVQTHATATFYDLRSGATCTGTPLARTRHSFLLIGLNGLFALSELSIVSARKARLKTMADSGRAGAATALRLAEDPGRFLSTVQIGITLVGILAGAFSGAALGAASPRSCSIRGMPERAAEPLGYGLVIGTITYLSVVVGELVPKHLALKNAEGIACTVAPLMARSPGSVLRSSGCSMPRPS